MSVAQNMKPSAATAGRQTMKVFIRDLVLACKIGIHQHERLAEQRVRINLELTAHEHPLINDDLERVICYADLMTGIRHVVGAGHINLIETLAERIASMCLEDPRVLEVKVRVEKLDVFKEAESVGVEIERRRT